MILCITRKKGFLNPSGVNNWPKPNTFTSAYHELWQNVVSRAHYYPAPVINTGGDALHKPQSNSSLSILKKHTTVFWQLHLQQYTRPSTQHNMSRGDLVNMCVIPFEISTSISSSELLNASSTKTCVRQSTMRRHPTRYCVQAANGLVLIEH